MVQPSLLLALLALAAGAAAAAAPPPGRYLTGGGRRADKLNVHLVCHSHDDAGWLKTVDQV